jgi:hypothetical protein
LLSIHLATNYAAVRAVSMRSLNRQRANIVFRSIVQQGLVLGPTEVSQRERIFDWDGVHRWYQSDIIVAHCRIGVPFNVLLTTVGQRHQRTGSVNLHATKLPDILDIFANEAYILWFADCGYEAVVVLKEGCTLTDQLKAWTHALLFATLAERLHAPGAMSSMTRPEGMRVTLQEVNELFVKYVPLLEQKGWDLSVAALETRAGVRTQLAVHNEK